MVNKLTEKWQSSLILIFSFSKERPFHSFFPNHINTHSSNAFIIQLWLIILCLISRFYSFHISLFDFFFFCVISNKRALIFHISIDLKNLIFMDFTYFSYIFSSIFIFFPIQFQTQKIVYFLMQFYHRYWLMLKVKFLKVQPISSEYLKIALSKKWRAIKSTWLWNWIKGFLSTDCNRNFNRKRKLSWVR